MFPACYFAVSVYGCHAPFGFLAPPLGLVRPRPGGFAAENPLTLPPQTPEPLHQLPLPFGTITSLEIKAFR